MAATTAETFRTSAGSVYRSSWVFRGWPPPSLAVHVKRYREAWPSRTPERRRVPAHPRVRGPHGERPRSEEPEETIMYYFPAPGRSDPRADRTGSVPAGRAAKSLRPRRPDALVPRDPQHKVAFGTGPAPRDRFAQLREELSLNGVGRRAEPGRLLPLPQETRSLQILTQHVMPRSNRSRPMTTRDTARRNSRRCATSRRGPSATSS